MSKLTKALTAAAGNAGGGALYVEDVFSTYLYTGTGSDININNGIDLAGEGGMVWFKTRSTANGHNIYDTERGNGKLQYITTEPTYTNTNTPWSPTSTGFNTGRDFGGSETQNGSTTVSWTFRKAPKFFDVVTYTGSTGPVAHNLGSVPKVIMIKAYSGTYSTNDWMVYHTDVGAPFLNLNDTGAAAGNFWTTSITDTHFTPPGNTSTNGNGTTYVAYLFASDAGGFGDDGSESIIKCGSYTGNGLPEGPFVDLGFEPQWLLIKSATAAGNWTMLDNMRGLTGETASTFFLRANATNAEQGGGYARLSPTGFNPMINSGYTNSSGVDYIYIAIRRPMKTPESGTEVFAPVSRSGTLTNTTVSSSFPVDLAIISGRTGPYVTYDGFNWGDRLRGGNRNLYSSNSGLENTSTDRIQSFAYQNAVGIGTNAAVNDNSATYINWFFKRATGFFDVVAYTGTAGNLTVPHSLNAVPELIIFKRRDSTGNWWVWQKDFTTYPTYHLLLNSTAAQATGQYLTGVTSSSFSLANAITANVNASGGTYATYLFASVDGVSKVGSYTGTGSNVDVDCGFSAGARFILIKRTDSTGDWYVWDSERGIVAGNDPYLLINSTAAEVTSTDYIDPLASGFTVTSSAPAALNASGGTYIFLAIA